MTPDEIKALRQQLGVSQAKLATRIGVSQNAVARWEGGDRRPNGSAVILLRQLRDEFSRSGATHA